MLISATYKVSSQNDHPCDSLGGNTLFICTDRPSQNETALLIPAGWLQVESGFQKEADNDKEKKINSEKILYNTTLWKYGLSRSFELRLLTEYANEKISYSTSDQEDTSSCVVGFKPIAIGSKIAIQKEKNFIPQIGLITFLNLPYFGSPGFRPQFVTPAFRFLFNHTLSEKFTLSYNLGAEWSQNPAAATGLYTTCLDFAPVKRMNIFLELYGYLEEQALPDHRADAGVTFLLKNNIQLDFSGGIGISEISPDYFVSGGLSFRFNTIKRKSH